MEMDVTLALADRMFAVRSTKAYRLTADELKRMSETPWFEEAILAKCGEKPIDDETWDKLKPEERRRLFPVLDPWQDCRMKVRSQIGSEAQLDFLRTYSQIYGRR